MRKEGIITFGVRTSKQPFLGLSGLIVTLIFSALRRVSSFAARVLNAPQLLLRRSGGKSNESIRVQGACSKSFSNRPVCTLIRPCWDEWTETHAATSCFLPRGAREQLSTRCRLPQRMSGSDSDKHDRKEERPYQASITTLSPPELEAATILVSGVAFFLAMPPRTAFFGAIFQYEFININLLIIKSSKKEATSL